MTPYLKPLHFPLSLSEPSILCAHYTVHTSDGTEYSQFEITYNEFTWLKWNQTIYEYIIEPKIQQRRMTQHFRGIEMKFLFTYSTHTNAHVDMLGNHFNKLRILWKLLGGRFLTAKSFQCLVICCSQLFIHCKDLFQKKNFVCWIFQLCLHFYFFVCVFSFLFIKMIHAGLKLSRTARVSW